MKRMKRLTAALLAGTMILSLGTAALENTPSMEWDEAQYWEFLQENEAQIAQEKRKEKLNLGVFYPDGINILMNGVPQRMVPKIYESGTLFVPADGFFTQLGGNYNPQSLSGSTEKSRILFSVGTGDVRLQENGKETAATMMASPRMADGQLYIPLRSTAELLGLDVVWYAHLDTVFLVDYEKVAAEIDEDFTVINRYLASNVVDYKKVYQMMENVKAVGTLYGDGKSVSGELGMELSGLMQGADMDVSGKLAVDVSEFYSILAENPNTKEMAELLKQPRSFPFAFITNAATGKAYFQSPEMVKLAASMAEEEISSTMLTQEAEKIWLSVSMSAEDGMETADLLEKWQSNLTVGSLVCEMERAGVTMDAEFLVGLLKVFLGDDSFTKSGDSYRNQMGTREVAQRMAKYLHTEQFYAQDLINMIENMPKVKYDLTISGSSYGGMSLNCKAFFKIPAEVPMEITIDSQYVGLQGTSHVEVKGDFVGKINITTEESVRESTAVLRGAPQVENPEYIIPIN